MPDPVALQPSYTAQQAQSKGLANLLKGGPLTGTVISHQRSGAATISFQGQSFTLNLKGGGLQPGQQVFARLAGGRIVLEPQTPAAAGTASSASVHSLGAVLSALGFSGQNAHAIAQALVGAGIPLDKSVLKELAQILPDAMGGQITALSFLFGRGLPVNPAIASLVTQIFSPKTKQKESVNKVLSSLKELDEDEEKNPVLPPAHRNRLRDARQQLESFILPLRQHGGQDYEEQLEDLFRAALASPEALIQGNDGAQAKAFGEAIVRLLALLMDLKPIIEGTRHEELLATLLTSVKELHETLTGRALLNTPPQTPEADHPVYFQIPFSDREQIGSLEVRYQPKGKGKKSGSLDLRLELTRIGPTLVSIHWEHPQLSVSIRVSGEETAQFIEPMLIELKEALEEKGFNPVTVGITVGEIPDTLQPDDELQENVAPSGLDLKA